MTKEQFVTQIIQQLSIYYSEDEFSLENKIVAKNNDTKLQGIIIRNKALEIAPTFYVDEFYNAYLQKKITISEIVEQLHSFADDFIRERAPYIHISMAWEDCQSKLVYRLVSREKNRDILQDIPHLPFLDMAIVFYVVYELSDYGLESIRVTNSMQETWGVSTKELFETAEFNTPTYFPIKVQDMNDIICEMLNKESMDVLDESVKIYIVSNEVGINGATVILYKDVMDDLARHLNANLYVIPSSIHEMLIIPDRGDEDCSLEKYAQMVKDVNQNHVKPEEILSDCAYYYNRHEKKFSF